MRAFTILLLTFSVFTLNGQNIIDELSFDYDGITHLEVEGSFAKVEVEGTSGSKLSFEGKITGRSNKSDVKIMHEKKGKKLHVWIERPTRSNNWNNNLNGALRFSVPKNITLDIDNSSGAVYVDNIDAEVCRLEASSGRVSARNIVADTYLETSSGRIEAINIKGELQSHSSSGGQSLRDIDGNIQSVASSGRIALSHTTGRLNLRNSSGGIGGEAITITGDSKFRSTSGSIKMEFTKDIESYTYDCSASSGSIYIGDKKVGKKAYYKYGDILIQGITTSGSQKYTNR